MALSALAVYRRAIADGSPDLRDDLFLDGRDPFEPGSLHESRSVEASIELNNPTYPCIIVSASGMASGGRVVHHLAHRLPDPASCVILVGYQAVGTRGRELLDGVRQLKMLVRYVPVHAEVIDVPDFSVHADADELIEWLSAMPSPPDRCYVVHAEPTASQVLAGRISEELGWCAVVPDYLEKVRLD